jgi:hypothetical protein
MRSRLKTWLRAKTRSRLQQWIRRLPNARSRRWTQVARDRPAVRWAPRPPDSPPPVAGRQREPSIPLTAPPSAAQRSPTACGWGLTNAARPLLALVAALAKQGRSSSIGRIPPCGPCGPRPSETKRFRLSPRHLTVRPHAASGADRRILPQALWSKRRAAEYLNENKSFTASTAKKMAVGPVAARRYRQRFATSLSNPAMILKLVLDG